MSFLTKSLFFLYKKENVGNVKITSNLKQHIHQTKNKTRVTKTPLVIIEYLNQDTFVLNKLCSKDLRPCLKANQLMHARLVSGFRDKSRVFMFASTLNKKVSPPFCFNAQTVFKNFEKS